MIRTLPGFAEITRRGQRARTRGAHSVIDADSFEAENAALDLDEFFGSHAPAPAIPKRQTDRSVIRGDEVRALDEMIEKHGIRAMLATLRSLCDSRCDNGCGEEMEFSAMLEAEESSDKWRAIGDALESLALSVEVKS